jgi:transcription elongation factor GreA-like protein
MDSSNNSTNEFIDDITLQFLTNKSQYNKYLSNYDKQKFDEINEFKSKINKNAQEILEITKTYMNNPDTQISAELYEAFEIYMKACIKHIEFKNLEKLNAYNYDKTEEVDTMFENIDNDFNSYWGSGVIKKK